MYDSQKSCEQAKERITQFLKTKPEILDVGVNGQAL